MDVDPQQTVQSAPLAVPPAITITLKQEEHPSTPKRDSERVARILSLIAIPVVLAVVGALIQGTLNRSTVGRDYVQLAVSVLTSDKDKAPPEFRSWAVDLLNENSPTKFSKEVAARLKAGEISLPGSIAAPLSSSNSAGMAVSPDGRRFSTGQDDGTIRTWDLSTGRLLATLKGHTDAITSLAYSPDGRTLMSGSADRTARLWDPSTGRSIAILAGHTDAVIGVGFTPDSLNAITRSLDGTVSFWDVATRKLVRKLQLR